MRTKVLLTKGRSRQVIKRLVGTSLGFLLGSGYRLHRWQYRDIAHVVIDACDRADFGRTTRFQIDRVESLARSEICHVLSVRHALDIKGIGRGLVFETKLSDCLQRAVVRLGLLDQRADRRVDIIHRGLFRERFLPLDTGVEPAIVEEKLWRKIEAALPARQAVVSTPPANDNRRNGWRATALSALAAALLMAVGLGWSLTRVVEPVVIAVLINEAGEAQAVVEDFGSEKATVRLLRDFDVPEGKTFQVWTLPSQEMGPVSLGLIDRARSVRLQGPSLPAPRNDQLYEITLEQQGGSPTGRPTGPIIAKGFARPAH
jgi:anti-sigma-K factor RskA